MNQASIRVFLRKDVVKRDGTCSVSIRVIINRKKKDYSLGISCHPDLWDPTQNRFMKRHPEYIQGNMLIEKYVSQFRALVYDSTINQKNITFSDVEKNMMHKPEIITFYDFAYQELENFRHTLQKITYDQYRYEIEKLHRYRPNLRLEEIDYEFLMNYEKYMITIIHNRVNTVGKTMQKLRKLMKIATFKKMIIDNPFNFYHIRSERTTRNRLSIEELSVMENLYQEKTLVPYKQNILGCFLFSCYTGLRYQDILLLKKEDINNGFVELVMHKTRLQVSVPIIEKAKKLIPGNNNDKLLVFNMPPNQVVNRYLKDIAAVVGINKPISFHSARHTFATISINLGIPIEIISKLLGHTDIKTTQIYAKVTDEVKSREMNKWNY